MENARSVESRTRGPWHRERFKGRSFAFPTAIVAGGIEKVVGAIVRRNLISGERFFTFQFGTVQHSARRGVIRDSAMHSACVVPDYRIADAPFVPVDKL